MSSWVVLHQLLKILRVVRPSTTPALWGRWIRWEIISLKQIIENSQLVAVIFKYLLSSMMLIIKVKSVWHYVDVWRCNNGENKSLIISLVSSFMAYSTCIALAVYREIAREEYFYRKQILIDTFICTFIVSLWDVYYKVCIILFMLMFNWQRKICLNEMTHVHGNIGLYNACAKTS